MTKDSGADDATESERPEKNKAAIEQGRRHHVAYSILFSLLFALLDVVFVWPENHLLAPVAAAAAFSIVAWAELPKRLALGVVPALFICALGAYWIFGPVHASEPGAPAALAAQEGIRARIQVESVSILNATALKGPITKVIVKNYGQTTAHNVTHATVFTYNTWPIAVYSFPAIPPPDSTASRIDIPREIENAKNFQRHPMTPDEREMLTKGKAVLYLYGEITYRDESGNAHFTHYKSIVGGPYGLGPAMIATPDGNDSN